MNNECYICESTDDLTHFPHLYVIGSEGCSLCLQCRISITDLVRNMRSASLKVKMKYIKKGRQNGKSQS